jgi:glutamyl-tRNA synthetase
MTDASGPRVRFAPSPTGYFHVGGARTALYNWLFARRLGGSMILRIEDTDRERSDEAWTEGILSALRWLEITWDEGPFHQSERRHLYENAAERLLDAGHLYACDCTREMVEARTKDNPVPGYDGFCRDRGLEPGPGRALRFRVPDAGVTIVHDLVRGDVEFSHSSIEDFIVVKSNGDPLFVLAVVVDDIDMGITHVIRAEEHLPTTPKAILLWQALEGPSLPVFAHLPVLVNAKRQKLSKRRDRVAVEDYAALGYLPEAMCNYLALLGWGAPDEREIFDRDELVQLFRLEDVNKSPAFFDEQRLTHFNGVYIRALSDNEFVERALPFLTGPNATVELNEFDLERFVQLAPLVKDRVATLGECGALVEFLFREPFVVDDDAFNKVAKDDATRAILEEAASNFATTTWRGDELKEALIAIGERHDRKLAKAQAPVRVATMGKGVGLPLFESLEVLGRDTALQRISDALARLG